MAETPALDSRKRKLSSKLTDINNVATPALKQQRLAIVVQEPRSSSPVQPATEESSNNDQPFNISAEDSDIEEHDVVKWRRRTTGQKAKTSGRTSRKSSQRSEKDIGGGSDNDIEEETAEKELERMMKTWDSWIYAFFEPVPAIVEENKRRAHVFKCAAKGCGRTVKRFLDTKDRRSTSNLHKHAKQCWHAETLQRASRVDNIASVREVVGKIKNSSDGDIAKMFEATKEKGVIMYSHRQHTGQEARIEVVRWVAESMRPLSIVADRGFQVLMKTGRPTLRLPSIPTVRRDVKQIFSKTKAHIAKYLQDYEGSLSFATDAWTSPNHRAYVALTVHLMRDLAPFVLVLDIVEVATSHSGWKLAEVFADVVKNFGIDDKILAVACDNASPNNKMTEKLTRHLPVFRGEKSRVRCFLHILNLVAKAILRQFDERVENNDEGMLAELEEDIDEDSSEDMIDDDQDAELMADVEDVSGKDVESVRCILQKLRRLSFAVKNSTTLLLPEWFKVIQTLGLPSRMIPRDVKTRWNSTYDMLSFILEYRHAINKLTDNRDLGLRNYEVSHQEWDIVRQLCKVLEIFKHATTMFSKATSNIAQVLPVIDRIDQVLTTNATKSQNLPCIQVALAVGKKLLNNYYSLTDNSEVYRIALILHPSYKLAYLKQANWLDSWVTTATDILKEEFTRSYASLEVEGGMPVDTEPIVTGSNLFDELAGWNKTANDAPAVDELTLYLEQPCEKVHDVLDWWVRRKNTFPRLSQMALDYHCIPATSVDVERTFSQGRILLSHTRNRLSGESTRSLMCLNCWFRSGLVETKDLLDMSKLPEVKEAEVNA